MIRDDIVEVKKEVNELRKKSFGYELLQDMKKQNKRLYTIWIITFIAFIGLLGYTLWLLNDVGTIETTTQEVSQENDSGNNNFIGNDGDIINGKTNN